MILVHEPEAEKLTVALYHRSSFGPADEIGRCQVWCRAQCAGSCQKQPPES